jgi:hypothetical protein
MSLAIWSFRLSCVGLTLLIVAILGDWLKDRRTHRHPFDGDWK